MSTQLRTPRQLCNDVHTTEGKYSVTENQEPDEGFTFGSEIWATIGQSTMRHIGTISWDEDEAAELARSMAEGDDTFFLLKLQESLTMELEARQRAHWLQMSQVDRDRIEAFLADPDSGVRVDPAKLERHRRIAETEPVAVDADHGVYVLTTDSSVLSTTVTKTY